MESIWLSSINCPSFFLCENILYGFPTSWDRAMATPHITDRAKGLGLPGKVVDGNDVFAVYQVVKKAVDRARAGQGPSLIERRAHETG